MTEFKEQFRLTLSNEGKIRNRAEAYLVDYAQKLLARPVVMDIHEVRELLVDVLGSIHPSWGTCRVSDVSIGSTIKGSPHLITRRFAIYGRGRAIFTLLISETVTKNASNGCAPVLYSQTPAIPV